MSLQTFLRLEVHGRFLHIPPHPKNQEGRRNAKQEHDAPGDGGREHRKEQRVKQRGYAPTHGPTRMHDSESLPAMLGTNHLAKENRAGSPLPAEPKPQKGASGKKLDIILRQAGQKREASKPKDRQLQRADAAKAIGKPAGEPAAER